MERQKDICVMRTSYEDKEVPTRLQGQDITKNKRPLFIYSSSILYRKKDVHNIFMLASWVVMLCGLVGRYLPPHIVLQPQTPTLALPLP
jgi:hypothetical protein